MDTKKSGRAVILFGYLNSASHFEEVLGDFDAFIKMVKFYDPTPK
jgi:hypothetical protein